MLQRLLEHQLFVKAEKCEFHTPSVTFLGFVIQQGQLAPDSAKVHAVAEWPTPTFRKQLQHFLGFANFYRSFIRNYSKVAAPFTCLTSTFKPFQWPEEVKETFAKLKTMFTYSPILSHPDPSCQFIVEVDASDTEVCAVLSQRDAVEQKLYPYAFFSRWLSPAEASYDVFNRELLAVVLTLQKWRHWLEGSTLQFVVWIDHQNLEYQCSAKRLNSRHARWGLFLGCFIYTLTYRPGSQNMNPGPPLLPILAGPHGPGLQSHSPPSLHHGSCKWQVEERVHEAKRTVPTLTEMAPNTLFGPEPTRSEVLQWGHSSRLACNPGFARTIHFIQRCFWWPPRTHGHSLPPV